MTEPFDPQAGPDSGAQVGRRRPWVQWFLGVVLGVVAVVLLILSLTRDPTADNPPRPAPSATAPSVTASSGASAVPEEPALPADEGSGQPGAAGTTMPLRPPSEHFIEDGTSPSPTSADSLEDGDYFGYLRGVDPDARTVAVDIAIFLNGQAAIDWLTVNDPEAENPPPNGVLVINEVERVRTLPLSPDVVVWTWCTEVGGFRWVERDLAQWATAPYYQELTCDAGAATGRDPGEAYWFDVRNGVVMQIVGQYFP